MLNSKFYLYCYLLWGVLLSVLNSQITSFKLSKKMLSDCVLGIRYVLICSKFYTQYKVPAAGNPRDKITILQIQITGSICGGIHIWAERMVDTECTQPSLKACGANFLCVALHQNYGTCLSVRFKQKNLAKLRIVRALRDPAQTGT